MTQALDIMRKTQAFESLTDTMLKRVLSLGQTRQYVAGQILFVEMSEGEEFFLLLDGTVSVQIALTNAEKPFEIITLGQGEVVGEISLVEHGPHSATVTAETQTTVLAWKCADLRRECEQDDSLGYRLILGVAKVLARRVRRWNAGLLEQSLWGMP